MGYRYDVGKVGSSAYMGAVMIESHRGNLSVFDRSVFNFDCFDIDMDSTVCLADNVLDIREFISRVFDSLSCDYSIKSEIRDEIRMIDDWVEVIDYTGSNDYTGYSRVRGVEMIHGSQTSERLHPWTFPYKGHERVCRIFLGRGYATIDALCEPFDENRWVVVHEIQDISTLSCFWLCYLVGKNGGVFSSAVTRVNPHRMDLTLHAMPSEGLHFRKCVQAAELEW